MPRFYTHSAALGDVPLKARTLDDAIREVRTGDWPDRTMDVFDAATREEVAVSIDVAP